MGDGAVIQIRDANGADVPAIREIFLACYGSDYPYPQYYDPQLLTKMVYSDDTLLLVAEDTDTGKVVGTASVLLEVGAYSDLVGEFGRLAVYPASRRLGAGKRLMRERLERVQDRLHVGIVEGRIAHPYSLKIAEEHEFCHVGFLPLKMLLKQRESLAVLVRYFGDALELRNNHPRIIPEVYPLAHLAMQNCGLRFDAIVDEDSAPYPPGHVFQVQELTADGYSALLRIERGRVRHREVFGPVRLHYGLFKLRARRSNYLLAREEGRIAGAVGFTVDAVEKVIEIFELIALNDGVIRFLLVELERLCREEWGAQYVEVQVSAYAPRMQRTLLELNFLPVAYLPALVFHEVERLDVVKMVRLLADPSNETSLISPRAQEIADIVMRGFRSRSVLPRIAQAVQEVALFAGLNTEQVNRIAGACTLQTFSAGTTIFSEGDADQRMYLLLEGEAAVHFADSTAPAGAICTGECLGETALLTGAPHSATAVAATGIEAAVLTHRGLCDLVRLRPDIGVVLYKNLAVGLGTKLRRSSLCRSGKA
jgi:GNAT superfamily N-acetyltransferase